MMGKVTMNHAATEQTTAVNNSFIDLYMKDANDAQIKVYLYLLRMMQAGLPTSVIDIADKFNDTEKDIMRALSYWEKKGLIGLEYDSAHHLTGVYLEDIPSSDRSSTEVLNTPAVSDVISKNKTNKRVKGGDEKENQQLVFLAEQYFGRTLNPSDIQKVFYIHHELEFSLDLMDYLMQYCAELGKKDFRYMEKVATAWHEANIKTPKQAKAQGGKYDQNVYTVMRELGYDNSPAPAEVAYIERWINEYGFSMDIIAEACSRSVLSTQKNRLQYADGILKSWFEKKAQTMDDISKLDTAHKDTTAVKTARPRSERSNTYMQFQQNSYDFELLEKELLKN